MNREPDTPRVVIIALLFVQAVAITSTSPLLDPGTFSSHVLGTPSSQATPEPLSLRTHQLMVCTPSLPCRLKGGPQTEAACRAGVKAEKQTGKWPDGTRIECVDLRMNKG